MIDQNDSALGMDEREVLMQLTMRQQQVHVVERKEDDSKSNEFKICFIVRRI